MQQALDERSAALARNEALLERVAKLERALQRIEYMTHGSNPDASPILARIDEITKQALSD
jgi:hypothetical protein